MWETAKLLVFVLGKVQIPDGFAHVPSTLTQMPVHFFQLLLSGQYSLHFLLMEALLFPGNKDNQKGSEGRCCCWLHRRAAALLLDAVPVLLLSHLQLAVHPQAQHLFKVQSIVQLLLQLLNLTTTKALTTVCSRPRGSLSLPAPTLDM